MQTFPTAYLTPQKLFTFAGENKLKMKYYLVAGEFSGDIHASNLMKCIKKYDREAEFRYIGGDKMSEQGGTMLKHYKEMAFMGFVEVLKNLKIIKANLSACKQDILNFKPDFVILVDYPGFNLRIAEFAHNQGFKTIYYISPKVWAWKKSRVKKIKQFIDKMFVIFPFEVEFYKNFGYEVEYVGNPTLDIVKNELSKPFDRQEFCKQNNIPQEKIIALLPGSRHQEVVRILPEMIAVARKLPDYNFVIAGVKNLPQSVYAEALSERNIHIVYNATYQLLRIADAAVVTSGTATLETALFNVPQVVCYKTSKLNYTIGKAVVKIKFFSLVNILLEKEAVKELLQKNLSDDIYKELNLILNDKNHFQQIINDYKKLEQLLGDKDAPCKAAKRIVEILSD